MWAVLAPLTACTTPDPFEAADEGSSSWPPRTSGSTTSSSADASTDDSSSSADATSSDSPSTSSGALPLTTGIPSTDDTTGGNTTSTGTTISTSGDADTSASGVESSGTSGDEAADTGLDPDDTTAGASTGPETDGTGGPEINLIPSGDFEGDSAGWSGFGGSLFSLSTAAAHGGLQSGYSTGRTSNWNGPAFDLLGVATGGELYHAEAWVLLDGTPTATVNITLASTCQGEGATYTNIAVEDVSDSAWTHIVGTFTFPSCALTEATFYIEGPAIGVSYYVDDVVVRP